MSSGPAGRPEHGPLISSRRPRRGLRYEREVRRDFEHVRKTGAADFLQ